MSNKLPKKPLPLTNWCKQCRFKIAPKGCDYCDLCAAQWAKNVLGVDVAIVQPPVKPKSLPDEPRLF
jgi:hypothetical protein